MAGKGDKRRPTLVDKEEFASNWDRIFKRVSDDLDGFSEGYEIAMEIRSAERATIIQRGQEQGLTDSEISSILEERGLEPIEEG